MQREIGRLWEFIVSKLTAQWYVPSRSTQPGRSRATINTEANKSYNPQYPGGFGIREGFPGSERVIVPCEESYPMWYQHV
jgi:hypothetical protein